MPNRAKSFCGAYILVLKSSAHQCYLISELMMLTAHTAAWIPASFRRAQEILHRSTIAFLSCQFLPVSRPTSGCSGEYGWLSCLHSKWRASWLTCFNLRSDPSSLARGFISAPCGLSLMEGTWSTHMSKQSSRSTTFLGCHGRSIRDGAWDETINSKFLILFSCFIINITSISVPLLTAYTMGRTRTLVIWKKSSLLGSWIWRPAYPVLEKDRHTLTTTAVSASKVDTACFFFNGHGSHLTYKFITYCWDHKIVSYPSTAQRCHVSTI